MRHRCKIKIFRDKEAGGILFEAKCIQGCKVAYTPFFDYAIWKAERHTYTI